MPGDVIAQGEVVGQPVLRNVPFGGQSGRHSVVGVVGDQAPEDHLGHGVGVLHEHGRVESVWSLVTGVGQGAALLTVRSRPATVCGGAAGCEDQP